MVWGEANLEIIGNTVETIRVYVGTAGCGVEID